MKITVREARKRLAKAGIELGKVCGKQVNSRCQPIFQVTTPMGTILHMRSSDVAGLLRDLHRSAI